METMIASKDLERVRNRCGFKDGLCLSIMGNSGGIGFWWDNINVQIVSYSRHHVLADVLGDDGQTLWCTVGIYEWPEQANKHKTWDLMRKIKDECYASLLFFGDFNEILCESEKDGGAVRSGRCIDAFREVVDWCGLRDLGFQGNKFTWQRGRSTHNLVRERLDRYLALNDWCNSFPDFAVTHLPIIGFDHAPIVLNIERRRNHHWGKKFFFESMWLSREECANVVGEAWNESGGLPLQGKIDHCGRKLVSLAKVAFKDRKKNIRELKKELSTLQSLQPSGPVLERCAETLSKLNQLLQDEESYWHLRSRVHELKDGDRNTSYFHHKANQRRKRNSIDGIFDASGCWKDTEDQTAGVIVDFYSELFSSSHPNNYEEAIEAVHKLVTTAMNEELDREPSAEEIFQALS